VDACRWRDLAGGSRKRRQCDRALLEHSEVAEQPPQQNENEDGAETAAAQFFRSVSRGDAAKQFAHRFALKVVVNCVTANCTDRTERFAPNASP
jgi:hypothetical protein